MIFLELEILVFIPQSEIKNPSPPALIKKIFSLVSSGDQVEAFS